MKLKLLSAVVLGLAVASAGINAAESDDQKVVAKVLNQENQVLAEDSKGSRRLLTQGAAVFDNEYLIVLENASVELQYVSSQCKVSHGANSLVTVTEESQCGSGQQIAVGQVAADDDRLKIKVTNAAGDDDSEVVVTRGSKAKFSGLGVGDSVLLPEVLATAGFVATVIAINDDDDPVTSP